MRLIPTEIRRLSPEICCHDITEPLATTLQNRFYRPESLLANGLSPIEMKPATDYRNNPASEFYVRCFEVTYADYGGWVISIIAGWIELIADNGLRQKFIARGYPSQFLCRFSYLCWNLTVVRLRYAGVNRSEIKGERAIVAILSGCEFPAALFASSGAKLLRRWSTVLIEVVSLRCGILADASQLSLSCCLSQQ
jgi:hypothetical protein